MIIRVPPNSGAGVPIGELLILLFLATFLWDMKWLPQFIYAAPIIPLVIWWGLGLGGAYIGLDKYGMWAFRDATHVIESLYLWIGFVLASGVGFIDRLFIWLRTTLNIGIIYGLTYPIGKILKGFSPKFPGASGQEVSILFSYTNTALLMIMAALNWINENRRIFGIPAAFLAGFIIVYVVAIFQARTIYLQIIALFIILAFTQRVVLIKMTGAMLIGIIALILLLATGIEFTGRLGEKVSIDFFIQHFATIWGAEGDGTLKSSVDGIGLRFGWWQNIWYKLNANELSLFFGLGYGLPLVDFQITGNIAVREPHNSLMSIFGRMGLVGIIAFLWMHISLFWCWLRTYKSYGLDGNKQGRNRLLLLLIFFILIIVLSLAQDAFEKPYNTIPYYFFWGVVLRMYYKQILAKKPVIEFTH